jgi:hypothetical protein
MNAARGRLTTKDAARRAAGCTPLIALLAGWLAVWPDPILAEDGGSNLRPLNSSGIGKIRRDESGRIVPDTRREMNAAAASVPGEDRLDPVRIQPGPIEPDFNEYAIKARQRQVEISQIVAQERVAKQRGSPTNVNGLTSREESLVTELRREDQEVRAHELAHYYSGRPHTSEPQYWLVVGPDGKRYAVAGHVQFDFAPIPGDAAATIRKYDVLRRAALAPRAPSPFDQKLANEIDRAITRLKAEARR